MGIYNSAVITNTGQALLAQSVAGNDLKFTTVKTSNYTYPSGTSLADLTTLTGIKQSKNITGATVYNSRVIKVSAMVDNAGVTAEYTINTIGVYATVGTAAEQLFAVITAQEADKMPAFNSRPYSYIYDLNMTMQGTSNITVTVNNAGFVNINDLNNALDGVNDSITDLDETVNGRIDTLSSSVDTRISALNDAIATLTNTTIQSYTPELVRTNGTTVIGQDTTGGSRTGRYIKIGNKVFVYATIKTRITENGEYCGITLPYHSIFSKVAFAVSELTQNFQAEASHINTSNVNSTLSIATIMGTTGTSAVRTAAMESGTYAYITFSGWYLTDQ